MAHNYILQVTAGSGYDITKHEIVPVNTPKAVMIDNEFVSVDLNVRIQSYRGLPLSSPPTSPYFSLPPHSKSGDQYSICFCFTPKQTINGNDLVFGNDFDHPIRDRLPPGFGTAFKIVKWVVDPGLDGDVYADRPYLYGPAGSSVNTLHVGSKAEGSAGKDNGNREVKNGDVEGDEEGENEDPGMIFEEGGDKEGLDLRREKGIPETEAGRKKHFLNEENRKAWEWEEGRAYGVDFFNPYLDFNDFALRLPGFTLPIMRYWDGQGLRYVLKNRATDQVLFVVLFTLYLKEDVDEEGNLKEGVEGGKPFGLLSESQRERRERGKTGVAGHEENGNLKKVEGEGEDNREVIEEKKKKKENGVGEGVEVETSADDVD